MQEQIKEQTVPVKVYRTEDRLMVLAPMPGLEPENIQVEVTRDGHLQLHGDLRATLKGVKDLLIDEWSIGFYTRDLELPVPVNGEMANLAYGNGVLNVTLPISEQTIPAQLSLEQVAPGRGMRQGNAGHPPM